MARKKVVQTDNMTLTSELPDDAIKDITGEDIEPDEVKPKTLSQQQSAALAQIPDDKPSKKDIFEEPKTVVAIDSKTVIDCLNFLKAHRVTPNYGSNGNACTCVLTDINGNSVMPIDELRNKPSVAYGDDKNRALINAVNSYKSTLPLQATLVLPSAGYAAGGNVEIQYSQSQLPDDFPAPSYEPILPPLAIRKDFNPWRGEMPKNMGEAYGIENPKEAPLEAAGTFLQSLRQIIRQEIKAQMKDKEDIKSQIMDLVKKLENL